MNSLKLKNITKVYKKNNLVFKALREISVSFTGPELVSVIGPNGCGKTTLLNIIALHDWNYEGHLYINKMKMENKNNSQTRNILRNQVSTISQFIELFNQFSSFENFEIFLSEQSVDSDTISFYSREFNVFEQLEMPIPTLSGGQKQKVALLASLLRNTDIIIADEPTSNLDIESEIVIFKLLKFLSKTKLVIIATHNKGLAYSLSNRVIELKDGLIISDVNVENEETDINIYNNHIIIPASMKTINNEWPKIYDCLEKNGSITMSLLNEDSTKILKTFGIGNSNDRKKSTLKNQIDRKMMQKKIFSFDSNKLLSTILSIAITVFVIAFFALTSFQIENALVDSIKGNEVERISFSKIHQQSGDFGYIEPIIQSEINDIAELGDVTYNYSLSTDLQIIPNDYFLENDEYSSTSLYGYIFAENNDFTYLAGSYPDDIGEAVITDYTATLLMDYYNISDQIDLIGSTHNFGQNSFTISGIIDTDCEKYLELKNYNTDMYDTRNLFRLNQKNIYSRLYLPIELLREYLVQNSMIEFISNRQEFQPLLVIDNNINSQNIVLNISNTSQGVYINETLYNEIVNGTESDANDSVLYLSVYSNQLSINENIPIIGVLSDDEYGNDYHVILSSDIASKIVDIYSYFDGIIFKVDDNFTSSIVSELDNLSYQDRSFISSNIYELDTLIVQGHDFLLGILIIVITLYFILKLNYINQDYKKNKKEIGLEKSLGWKNSRIIKINLVKHIIFPFIELLAALALGILVFKLINWMLTSGVGYVVQLVNISISQIFYIFLLTNISVYLLAMILVKMYIRKDIKELLK
jgi:ABC-type lipoprotein export system ATPase subunit